MIPRLKKTHEDVFIKLDEFLGNRSNNLPTKTNDLPNQININEQMAWFLGYFVGDGSAGFRGKVSCLVADTHMDRDYQKVLDGLKQFGLPITERKLAGCLEIQVHSYQLARAMRSLFYINKFKTIPRWLYQRFPQEVFDGLMAADGHYCQKGNSGKQGTFTNKSKMLMSTIRDLLSYRNLTGKNHTRHHRDAGNSISYSITWTEYGNHDQAKFYHSDDDYIYLKIRKIIKKDFNDYVYNIDVEGDHSYLTGGIAVHNCISAMKAQSLGAIPFVTNYAALEETVKHGIRVDVDITDPDQQAEYFDSLITFLKDDDKREAMRQPMIDFSKGYFPWKNIASEWSNIFNQEVRK